MAKESINPDHELVYINMPEWVDERFGCRGVVERLAWKYAESRHAGEFQLVYHGVCSSKGAKDRGAWTMNGFDRGR